MRVRLMARGKQRERINVGTRRGTTQESFSNPADYFQFMRQMNVRPNMRQPAGYGFYQGKPEFSMGFRHSGTPSQLASNRQKALTGLGQESVYTEGKKGYAIVFQQGGMQSKLKYRIRILNGRILADSGFARDVYRYQTLQRAISEEKSSNYLFTGGNIVEDGNDLIIISAEFDEKQLPAVRQRISQFVQKLTDAGIPARAQVVKK